MKKQNLTALLTAGCSVAGLLGMAVRKWLLSGTDGKGLLTAVHAGSVISWVLTALVILVLGAAVLQKSLRCRFPEGPFTHVCHLLQAAALAVVGFRLFGAGSSLATTVGIVALVCSLCVLAMPVCKFLGKDSPSLLRCTLIVFYLLFLICSYQNWSSEPELQRYVFQLLALVCLTLSAYQRAALDMELHSGRIYLFTSRAGLFFCLAAVPGAPYPLFYLLTAAATVLDGCTDAPKRRA